MKASNEILVSVVIPIFNSEKYINETIESVINQKDIGYEVIIVNDGSTDRSREICEEYISSNIKLIDQLNSGAPAARNNGLDHASGKFVLFLDSDDLLYERCFEIVESELNESEKACVIGNFIRLSQDKNTVENSFEIHKTDIDHCFFIPPYPCNKFYNRQFLIEKKLKFSNLKITQDLNFFFKFLGSVDFDNIQFIDYPVCSYRYVENSISHSPDMRIIDVCKSIDDCEMFYTQMMLANDKAKVLHVASLRHICYQIEKCSHFKDNDEGNVARKKLQENWKLHRKKAGIIYNPFLLKKYIKAHIQYIYTLFILWIDMRKTWN